jgi:hypothetical protein
MSRLNLHMRPYELFDVNNARHRKLFSEFQRTQSWRHAPIRFTIESDGEMIPTIQRELLAYYQAQEFAE